MNDDPTLTALRHRLTEVRDSLGDVHMTIPASEIFGRDRRRRARHQLAAAVGATAVVAAAVAVSVVLPASHPAAGHPAAGHAAATHATASHPAREPGIRLVAWTVTRQAGGTIKVTFREATDAAGLQRTLRADGVPASVTFTGHQNPACQFLPLRRKPGAAVPGSALWGPDRWRAVQGLSSQP